MSCDWGTSHFRLRLVERETLKILAEIQTAEGAASIYQHAMESLREHAFAEVFQRHALDLLSSSGRVATQAVISGMASSAIGWKNLPYARAPIYLTPEHLRFSSITLNINGGEMLIRLISGVQTENDMMRGEETELLGLLHALPELTQGSARLIFPGTHSKHLQLENGELIGISTFMTGELFAHLQSLPTLAPLIDPDLPFNENAYLKGVEQAAESGMDVSLFSIRASSVLAKGDALTGTSFLSGLLIGSELSRIRKGVPLQLFGTEPLSQYYLRAAQYLELSMELISADIVKRSLVLGHSLFLPSS